MSAAIEVQFDAVSTRLLRRGKEVWSLRWEDVERIGYRTAPGGPWYDYFLVFKKKGDPATYYQIPMECPGALDLCKYVDGLPGTKLPREGKLANSIKDKTVTVWPAEKSGQPL